MAKASLDKTSLGFRPKDSANIFRRSILEIIVFGLMLKPLGIIGGLLIDLLKELIKLA